LNVFSLQINVIYGMMPCFRDPRMKRLADQQQLKQLASQPVPEKLSFKEKMKMFAMESGELGPCKNRLSNSRAQRDIEGPHMP
jgi:afadin